jgi:hypothetical protein
VRTIRNTILWLALILLIGGAVGGRYALQLWNQSDELLREKIVAMFREHVPDWQVAIGRAKFDLRGEVHLYDCQLATPGRATPLLMLPEIVMAIDPETLTDKPEIQRVRYVRPQIHLARDPAGRWNFQDLNLPGESAGRMSPEVRVEQATVTLRFERPGGGTPATVTLREADLQLIPSGRRRYRVTGQARRDSAEIIKLSGDLNLAAGTWSMAAAVKDLAVNQDLLQLIADVSPAARSALAQAAGSAVKLAAGIRSSDALQPITSASPVLSSDPFLVADRNAGPDATSPLPNLGLTVVCDVDVRFAQWKSAAENERFVKLVVKQGDWRHEALPDPWQDVRGTVTVDNRQVTISDFSSRAGSSQLRGGGRVFLDRDGLPAELTATVTDIELEERLRALLPAALRGVYDDLHPGGKVDATFQLLRDSRGAWDLDGVLTTKSCTARHVKFPYPIEQITGTVTKRGDILDISMNGIAGGRPVTLIGRVKNPGREAEAEYRFSGNGLAIDDDFRTACPPKMRSALDALRLQGTFDGTLVLLRSPGPNQPYLQRLWARLSDCTAKSTSFPYAMTNLSGIVQGVGEDYWFQKLTAEHDGAKLAGEGTYLRQDDGSHVLELAVTAVGAAIDSTLFSALPASQQAIWNEFNPTGRLNVTRSSLLWKLGLPPQFNFNAELVDAGLLMKSFPFPLSGVRAKLTFDSKGSMTIESLTGRNEETRVSLKGEAKFDPNSGWKAYLYDLHVDDLVPDQRFRKTLRAGLREIVDTLDPRRGKLSITGELDFLGSMQPGVPVTAAWDFTTVYSGATLTAGVELENMVGTVRMRGTWDDRQVVGTGQIDLDSVFVKGYQLTQVQGPFRIEGTQLVLGSRETLQQLDTTGRPPKNLESTGGHVVARAIEGMVTLDAVAKLEGVTSYHMLVTLQDGNLARYAQQYMTGRNKLHGLMNGWADLRGRGPTAQGLEGRGQLLVSPAALYELPVIVAILNALTLAPTDKTAFRQAKVDFTIGGERFLLRPVLLEGDSISLWGGGSIAFNGNVNMEFRSSGGRNRLPIPFVNEFIGVATKGAVGVEVRGTTKAPIAKVKTLPEVEEGLKALFGGFEPPPNVLPPPAARRPGTLRK